MKWILPPQPGAGCVSCMLADYSAAVNPPSPYLTLPRRVGSTGFSCLRNCRLIAVDDDGALRLEVVIFARDQENRRVSRLQRKLGAEVQRGGTDGRIARLAGR